MAVRTDPRLRGTSSVGALVILLGLWALVVPLVGPYFDFGFVTDDAWAFTREQWLLSIGGGALAILGGLAMLMPLRGPAWLGGTLALVAGIWLVVGPSVYPVFSDGEVTPMPASDGMTATLWIGYFYGPGALIVYLSGLVQGVARRRPAEVVEERRVVEEPREPVGDLEPEERPTTTTYP